VSLIQVSLLLTGQQCLGDFFRYQPFLPIGWIIVQIFRQRQRKIINTEPAILGAIQASSQSTLFEVSVLAFVYSL
jgi:hypothetical protein